MDECEDPSENGMMDRDDIYIIFDHRKLDIIQIVCIHLCRRIFGQ